MVRTIEPCPSRMLSWDLIAQWLMAEFQSPVVQHSARRELNTLRQTGSLQEYTSVFRSLEYKLPFMSDADKQFAYREGLTNSLADALAQSGDFPSLHELIATTAMLGAQLRAASRPPSVTDPARAVY